MLVFVPEDRLLPLRCVVTFMHIPSIAVHRPCEARDIHWDLYNNKRVPSPFCSHDENWKDAIRKH